MARPKLPEKTKQMRGTQRKCRAVDDGAFDSTLAVSLDDVKAPSHLSADAKKVYKTVVAQLFAMNLLQPVDQPALCMFANAIATVYKMQQVLDEEGYVVDAYNKDGDVIGKMVSPAQKIMKDAINTANTIGSQFGWSPQARMRLVAMLSQKEEKKDDFNQMING